jgi:hypothetical protein
MKSKEKLNTECCPKFDPQPWDDKVFDWKNRKFIKDKVNTFFYMPMNFGKVMRKLDAKIRKAEATMPDWICLSDHTSKWNMYLYLSVDKDIPDCENTTLNGKFFSKVYEGPFKDTGKWSKDYKIKAKDKGFDIKKWYMWYTTCPKCAKKYGKNYVVLMSKVD